MEPDSEIKLVRVSGGTLPALAFFDAKLGFRAGLFTCVWDSHVRFSESFELEHPSVVFVEIRFRPSAIMYTMSGHVRTTLRKKMH